jgi:2-polyprenyl-3-methyl-5-hydroxy-6-metoxy-1,4-benzoquinol methylase
MTEERKRLDDVAEWYSATDFEGLMVSESARRIVQRSRGSTVLEVGCAEGHVTRALSAACDRIVVVEAATNYAEMVRRIGLPNVEVVNCLFEEFVTDDRFETIVLSHVLEHVTDPVGLLRKCAALLEPNGVALVAVPNAGSVHRRIGVEIGVLTVASELSEADVQIGHRRVYDEVTLRRDIEAASLRVKELRGQFLKPLSNAQMTQLPIDVQEAFMRAGDALPAEFASELLAQCEVIQH